MKKYGIAYGRNYKKSDAFPTAGKAKWCASFTEDGLDDSGSKPIFFLLSTTKLLWFESDYALFSVFHKNPHTSLAFISIFCSIL
ncbi:MAG: hypothetical protein HUN04_22970 [Desulfobacter sp.]|nr:MAG: hypothetical protein HUN04_22970 [Desulfobacter sp.]